MRRQNGSINSLALEEALDREFGKLDAEKFKECKCGTNAERERIRVDQSIPNNPSGTTYLCKAAGNGCLKCVKWFLDCGTQLDKSVDFDDRTAVWYAAWKNQALTVRFLAQNNANIMKPAEDGGPPLLIAAQLANNETCALLVKYLGADVDQAAYDGYCAFILAAEVGNVETVKLLGHQLGANVHQTTNDGANAAFLAAYADQFDSVKCVMEEFGTILNFSYFEKYPEYPEREEKAQEIQNELETQKKWLKESKRTVYNLGICFPKVVIDLIFDFFPRGWHPAFVPKEIPRPVLGDRCLCSQACEKTGKNRDDLIRDDQFEVWYGTKNHWRRTYSLQAAKAGCLKCLKWLYDHEKIDFRMRQNTDGWTALHFAAVNGHTNILEYVLDNGADVNQADNLGRSPLFRCTQYGRVDAITFLHERGADINKADNNNLSPILQCVKFGHKSAIECLLGLGAVIDYNVELEKNEPALLQRILEYRFNLEVPLIQKLFQEDLKKKLECYPSKFETQLKEVIDVCVKSDAPYTRLLDVVFGRLRTTEQFKKAFYKQNFYQVDRLINLKIEVTQLLSVAEEHYQLNLKSNTAIEHKPGSQEELEFFDEILLEQEVETNQKSEVQYKKLDIVETLEKIEFKENEMLELIDQKVSNNLKEIAAMQNNETFNSNKMLVENEEIIIMDKQERLISSQDAENEQLSNKPFSITIEDFDSNESSTVEPAYAIYE